MRHAPFACRICPPALTDFLRERPACEAVSAGEPMVAAGHFVRVDRPWSYRDFVTGRRAEVRYLSADGEVVAFATGDFLLDAADVAHTLSPGARHGCCGPQPRGEANAVCTNGHEIGTLHGDACWSPLVFRLLRDAVVEIVL